MSTRTHGEAPRQGKHSPCCGHGEKWHQRATLSEPLTACTYPRCHCLVQVEVAE